MPPPAFFFASGNVDIQSTTYEHSAIFACGSVRVGWARDVLIVADGDVTVDHFAQNCVIIAHGTVTCRRVISNCRIISGKNVIHNKKLSKASTIIENAKKPLGFIQFFDPANEGVAVELSGDVVRVMDATSGKPFRKAGLRKGDVILRINETAVGSTEVFRRILRRHLTLPKEMTFHVKRGGKKLAIRIPPQWHLENYAKTDIPACAIEPKIKPPEPFTFVVNTTNDTLDAKLGDGLALDDNGKTSLRAAIDEALRSPGNTYTIRFAPALANQTITLGIELRYLKKNFIIDGTGARNLTIRRSDSVNVFRMLTVNEGATVEIRNLTFANGRASGVGPRGCGGGIYNAGTLRLTNVNFCENKAIDEGGAIYNAEKATLKAKGCYAYWNKAKRGGGIANAGDASIEGGEIFVNAAGKYGGGVANNKTGVLKMNRVDVFANQALNGGGGIVNFGPSFTLKKGNIYSNKLTGKDARGGGLLSETGSVAGYDVRITENEANGKKARGRRRVRSRGHGAHDQN